MACQINSGTIHSQPQNEFIGRSVTPNLSSESFYSCAEPVKLFNTPETVRLFEALKPIIWQLGLILALILKQ